MSLETLLEAARYVELQEAQRLQQTSIAREEEEEEEEEEEQEQEQEDPLVVPSPPSPARQPPPPPPPHTNGHPLDTPPPGEDSKDFQKRAAGTREVHNKLEKNRRAHLKECFEILKKTLPASQDEKKSSNLSILHSALRYIQSQRRKEREFEHEMERLAREKIALQQRLAGLKKDLSAQWDHIDFSALLPNTSPPEDPRVRDHVSHTTSTASERDGTISDTEEPLSKCGVLYSSTSSLSSAATACSPPQQAPPVEGPIPPTIAQHHVQLPVSTHMVSAGPGLVVSPTIQLLTPSGLRMLPTEPQPLALTVHHSSSPHLPTTTVTSHHRLRDSPDLRTALGKVVAAGSLPGGAELNLLPANGTLRPGKPHPITLSGGLTLPNGVLSHAGVTLTTKTTPLSLSHGPVSGITHVVTPLGGHHAGLAPLVTPVTVVSQGSQVAHIIAASPQQIGGKMLSTTPLLKSMGPVPLMSAQYLGAATLVKPVVVVSSPSILPPHTNA